jgi:mannose-1-phosphate guanylyltransferase
MYVVVMAGGGGTRLHPLSTPERPKPFLPLLGGESLLQRTVSRLLDGPELRSGAGGRLDLDDVHVVTSSAYAPLVAESLPGVAIVEEPMGRNTAAAIALAATAIDRPMDEVMIVLPADHTIEREAVFRRVLADAATGLAPGAFGIDGPLVTLGIQPDRAATEYGYLRPDVTRGEQIAGLHAYPLRAFIEKPDAATAEGLIGEVGVAWNAGIFLWRRDAILDAFRTFAPDILEAVEAGAGADRLAAAYGGVRSTSIDYAVMEGAADDGAVLMAGMDVGWSDLGGWTSLLTALGASGAGRVLRRGDDIDAGPSDLVVRRHGPRLAVEPGPLGGILSSDEPIAVLSGALPDRTIVEALVARCSAPEAHP